MYRAALLVAVLVLAAACGSDGDNAAGTTAPTPTSTVSAGDAKSALETELSQGGGGGIVHHDSDVPKLIACQKDAATRSGWRCRVTPGKSGDSYLCTVEVDPQTKRATKTTCGRIDN
jgi:hypothetical protein